MKKLISLAMVLFFAVAAAAETYVASEKITQQVLSGELSQTVYAGDEIKPVKILYENTGVGETENPEYSSSNFLENFGLSKIWKKGPVCEISGEMRSDIPAGTYNAFIIVKDDEGKFAKTEFTFIVKEKPFSLEWNESSGPVNQSVKAGNSITPIVFDYEGITNYSVSGLPSGLAKNIDNKRHKIMITGTVNSDEMSGDYEYKVTVENDQGTKLIKSGTITVIESKAVTSVRVVENEKQEVVAGNDIKPVVFEFANVRVDDNLSSFKYEGSLKGSFKYSVKGNKFTFSGTVDENLKGGLYTIRIIAIGENNNDTAFANVEVTHKSVETKVTVIENETQSLTAGDSIKPIVFQIEHGSNPQLTNFPGGYELKKDGNTVTITGLVEKNARGPYDVVLSVTGVDNNASAKATINVTPGTMTFNLVEGSDNQTVVAGQDIVPIVYQYDYMLSAKGSGFPADLKVEQDHENRQIKISGTVNSESAAHEYVYSFALTDVYGAVSTVTGKINVVRESSSSSVASSASDAASSSSEESSSSSVVASSSSAKSSSSAEQSSSSVAASSNSVVASSSSAKSSSSAGQSSSSVAASSNSVVASSSSAKSSSSTATSSSSEKTTGITTVAMNSVKFGFVNNVLTVALPNSAMLRVQVFDMMGHLVESFAETETSSNSFSLAHLTKGNYVVRIESARSVRTTRILVK